VRGIGDENEAAGEQADGELEQHESGVDEKAEFEAVIESEILQHGSIIPKRGPKASVIWKLFSVRAAGPAAGTPFTLDELHGYSSNVVLPRLLLLHRHRPADPLVTCERRNVLPHRLGIRVRSNGLPEVVRNFVDGSGFGGFLVHDLIIPNRGFMTDLGQANHRLLCAPVIRNFTPGF
jgi:hypothetical protein